MSLQSMEYYKSKRKDVPCRRVTLLPEPSFTVRLYEKVVPADRAKTWFSRVGLGKLVPGRRGTNSQSVYMENIWLAPQGHPTYKASE